MSTALSVLCTKHPSAQDIGIFFAEAKEARNYVKQHSSSSSAFLETIADIDNAHFISMYEMQKIVEKLYATTFNRPPKDRLVAAKDLANALREKQKDLPRLSLVAQESPSAVKKFYPPASVVKPCKAGTKLALFAEAAMKGATVAELCEVVGWKPAAVVSCFNWDFNKCRGFGYTVEKKDGVDFYRLMVPESYTGPIVK